LTRSFDSGSTKPNSKGARAGVEEKRGEEKRGEERRGENAPVCSKVSEGLGIDTLW